MGNGLIDAMRQLGKAGSASRFAEIKPASSGLQAVLKSPPIR
jgi:hypothetical protein